MPPDDESRTARSSSSSKPHLASTYRLPQSHIPDRLRMGDDEHEDMTAPPAGTAGRGGRFPYMHQSVFSMIAAASSKNDFHSRFDESSDAEDEDADVARLPKDRFLSNDGVDGRRDGGASTSHVLNIAKRDKSSVPNAAEDRGRPHHRKRLSENKFLKSLAKLPHRGKGKVPAPEPEPDLDPTVTSEPSSAKAVRLVAATEAPVLSRMLDAQSRFGESEPLLNPTEPPGKTCCQRKELSPSSLLSARLMDIFGFDRPEKVISEYQCWLLQSVLLQGYMYITEKHISFYAYLPKKPHTIIKSGYLSKRGRQNPKYNRYWVALKEDVLSYYMDPSNLYFPSGHVDLRYGISANLAEQKGKDKDTDNNVKDFTITTNNRIYQFRADSATSAREWVKTLQKVIFRSHNDGDSVKISLPIENVIDIEENPVIDFAHTFKIRVVESGESYAIDEYFFSFFECGKEAIEVLKKMANHTPAQHIQQAMLVPDGGHISGCRRSHSVDVISHPSTHETTLLAEAVKATLRPLSPLDSQYGSPKQSQDLPRSHFRTFSRGRRQHSRECSEAGFEQKRSDSTNRASVGDNQDERSAGGKLQNSSDSFVQSLEHATESSAILQSTSGTVESASQILNRSDVFRSPTIHRLQNSLPGSGEAPRRHSEDTARFPPTSADLLPLRTQTTQSLMKQAQQDAGSDSEHDLQHRSVAPSASSPTLQELMKAGSYPLQRAAGFAGYLRNRSKHMSNLLATESMGYFEKVSGMWIGGKRHYGDGETILSDDKMVDPEDEEQGCEHGDRFRTHFALPPSEKLQATYFAYLHRVIPLYGKLYISNRKFCFRSLLPGTRTKMILPLKDIENVEKEKGFRFGYHGLVVIISGHEELFFEFNTADARDDCAVTLHQNLESIRYLVESGLLAQQEREEADAAMAEHQMLEEARLEGMDEQQSSQTLSTSMPLSSTSSPILFDDPRVSIVNFKPQEALRITCLTIGSRGDVQPYIALCKGLLAEGHIPKIATHREFEPWIRSHGIDFAPVEGDPAELMRICVENGMFTYSFLKEASSKFRGWIDDLLSSAWTSCQNSDILIESPSAMAGIHIAEALGIPYFRAFTMPWTRTRAYPHAFAVPEHKMGGAYNYITYVMFDNVFWKAIAGQVNRWRKRELGLRSTNLDKMQPNKVPFLYNFSPSVVPPPLDFCDWIRVTGYWFLDEGANWQPPVELENFIKQARADEKKIVYIGFGSIVVSDPAALTKTVVDSVLRADVRCILSKGWSDRLGDPSSAKAEIPLPPEIHQIKSAPHDWLFSQIDAAAHHGGAGTTGASLRAGIPTIIKPFFGDQFFFGSRVEDLGVGICMKRLNVSVFSRALWEATHSERIIVKAKTLGEQIRKEDGVATAIQAIYRDLEYAKTLVRQRSPTTSAPQTAIYAVSNEESAAMISSETSPDDDGDGEDDADADAAMEDSWTFVGDETETDVTKKTRARERDYDIRLDNVATAGVINGSGGYGSDSGKG
ncbi:UDP-glucose:sterol glycosyltransferase [Histoplasma capsulatum G186AR]|uniref:Sterol 3-beta-glucosyltransferase n=1 Tax=Ajellomyces capsulatus TaxID=5037 RepID=A0A8H8D8K9_AJECA|nr:UDP-glucose:sterol glycosyltransferase [Histoplasma capsulatum]QSS69260.1 UDP-glucose:sterol glycosyltransferase [Histoplasma capsulatum G186AR]